MCLLPLKYYLAVLVENDDGGAALNLTETANSLESPGHQRRRSPITLIVHVPCLQQNDAQRLAMTLQSLWRSDYADHHVQLTVHVRSQENVELSHKYTSECIEAAKSFMWPHGTYSTYHTQATGDDNGLASWLSSWKPSPMFPRDLGVFIDSGTVVSRVFFRWLLEAHSTYHQDVTLIGMNLQRSPVCQ